MNEEKKGPSYIVVFGGGFLVLCVLVVVYAEVFMDDPPATAPTSSPAQPVSQPVSQQDPPPKPSPLETVLKLDSLDSAIATTSLLMGDSHNEMNAGASLLAIWSLKKLTWSDLQAVRSTKIGLVNKDPTQELGKRICGRGRILEIQADRSEYGVGYSGGIFMGGGYDIVRFYAVGSTGDLVADRRATICGVFTGRYSYDNTGGGTTIAPFIVGMFKLPENLQL